MFLNGLATAVPPNSFAQQECWEALQKEPRFLALDFSARELLKKLLCGASGVARRHFALNDLSEAFVALTPDALHDRFARHAPALATQAAARALDQARITAREADALIISTCTGYLCPGLTSYVSEQLGLRADAACFDLVGQGCGAALPNCRMADALIASGRARHVLSVCVEICSAAFYLDNDRGVLVSACLFGDGAAAAVWSDKAATHARRVEWNLAGSVLNPAHRDSLRFEQRNGMLRNLLERRVPVLVAKHAGLVLEDVLRRAGVAPADVSAWILHAGGPDVLHALQKQLCLAESALHLSASVLRDFGNLSSPFVLFVLERALAEERSGGWWWMSSFGAGFSCHGALLKVE